MSRCARCHNLEFSTDERGLRIDLAKFQRGIEGVPDLEYLAEWYHKTVEESSVTCPLCKLLWNGAVAVLGPTFYKDRIRMDIRYLEPRDRGGPLSVYLVADRVLAYYDSDDEESYSSDSDGEDEEIEELQFFLSHNETEPPFCEMIGKGYDISPYGISETCINLARQWLYECTNCLGKHAKCQLIKPAQLPTRVIDVEEMRLYATIPGDAGQYVALSHCWGGSHPVRTTIDNLESHMVRLPESLPQTFADAIAVTKALSLRYLWIDSLCIVQDSKEDWSSESAHMAKVYENAFVTISADGAKDSFEGFLSAPSRSIRPAKVIQYSYVDGAGSETSRNVFVRQRGKLGLMLPYHDFPKELSIPARNQRRQDVQHITRRTEMEEAPSSRLSTRGWVFQERFLSPRTLHFATSELGWECRSICTCECSTTSFRPVRKTSLLKYWLSDFRPDTNHTYWRTELVREYSRLDLTVPSDRLVAFSGLAEAVSRLRPGDAYLAGLWKNTLRWDLLWCVQDKRESKRLGNLVAPSWSWASVDGPVVYPLSRRGSKLKWVSQRFTIEQIDLTPASVNPFGAVEPHSYIRVHGWAMTVAIGYDKSKEEYNVYIQDTSQPLAVTPDVFDGRWYSEFKDIQEYGLIFLAACCSERGPCGLLLKPANEEVLEQTGMLKDQEADTIVQRIGYVQPQEVRYKPFQRRGSYDAESEYFSFDPMLHRMTNELLMIEHKDAEDDNVRNATPSISQLFQEVTVVIV